MQPKKYSPIEFDFILSTPEHTSANNGIDIYKMLNTDLTAVQIEWTFEAGLWHEKHPGLAQTAGRLLKNGTHRHSEFEINEQLEAYGASLRIMVNNDYTHIVLMTLNKHLSALLPIVKEIITEVNFSEEELKIFISNAIQTLDVNLQKNDFIANRLIEEQLFGIQHPYGRYLNKEQYEAITREQILEYYHDHFCYNNCKIFVAGGLREEDEKLLISLFGEDKWNDNGYQKSSIIHPIHSTLDKSISHEMDNNNVQSAIRMARHTMHRDGQDFLTLQFLNIIFGGYFGSRLMSNIREDKGYTYGIYSYLASHRHNSYLIISTEVDNTYTDATIHEIKHEMEILRHQVIPEEELWMAKNYVLGSLIGDMDGVLSLIQMWRSMILQGHGLSHFTQKIETFKNIDAEALQKMAQAYLNPEEFYTTIVH